MDILKSEKAKLFIDTFTENLVFFKETYKKLQEEVVELTNKCSELEEELDSVKEELSEKTTDNLISPMFNEIKVSDFSALEISVVEDFIEVFKRMHQQNLSIQKVKVMLSLMKKIK